MMTIYKTKNNTKMINSKLNQYAGMYTVWPYSFESAVLIYNI